MMPSPEPLTTERIVLEPLRVAHAVEMAAVLDDPALHRHVGGKPMTLEELRRLYTVQVAGRSADGAQRWLNIPTTRPRRASRARSSFTQPRTSGAAKSSGRARRRRDVRRGSEC
jgi:hypothetical protein